MFIRFAILAIWCAGIFYPSVASADVRINEIAWMGTEDSHTNEWIELYNTSAQSIDLSGWRIVAADDSPVISLSGSIPGNGVYLLERTDDGVVAPAADHIYTGSLSNSGEVLQLVNGNGTTVFSVDGTDGWGDVGGNNAEKHTAQYIQGSWGTAAPTPAAENADTDTGAENVSDTNTDSSGADTQEAADIFEDTTIHVHAGVSRTVTAGAATTFRGKARGFTNEPLTDATYTWSFGDGTRTEGKQVSHTFKYPGRYAVVLTVSSGKFMGRDVIPITAEPPRLEITDITQTFIEVTNNAARTIDLSRWFLKRGDDSFQFPEVTRILSSESIRFDMHATELATNAGNAAILYPNGETVATNSKAAIAAESQAETKEYITSRSRSTSGNTETKRVAENQEPKTKPQRVQETKSKSIGSSTTHSAATLLATSTETGRSTMAWVLAAVGVIGLGVVGAAMGTKKAPERNTESGYTIIDMGDED